MRKTHLSLDPIPEEEGLVNLTPLIDVVFVVLILFILIAPLLELDRINLASSGEQKQTETTRIEENASLKIHVYADNTVWVNHSLVNAKDLLPILQKYQKQMPDTTPQVFHDKEAFFGTYQVVKNSLEAAGFKQMDVILKPDS